MITLCNRWFSRMGLLVLFCCAATLLGSGCRSADPSSAKDGAPPPEWIVGRKPSSALKPEEVRLNPGDVVQVNFPGAQTLNTVQRVQLNGMLQMPLIGEIVAAGRTPPQLEADLRKAYDKQLQVKEVNVIVSSSAASIFVSGAVSHPGRITMERPLTVLEAIMEAGGFDPRRANVKKVAVIREKDGKYTRQTLNLKPVLNGEDVQPVYLQPFDIVYVPEKLF